MPEPILTAVATALATKAATGLYELVKRRFSKDEKAVATLEAANPGNPASIQALAERLDTEGRQDPAFATELRSTFEVHQSAGGTAVHNHVGQVAEGAKVVQMGDVHGNVNL
ncbi:hypothetical protein [Amycolatopsis panacis]|uniref:Uncharacterized protein n=1 Tax=Amycolatopsis panacis TaxID=2340917 RepID=A0A419IAY2_9PSEU|nr:hypothetical protein [Amycolatopsis panacis]RJQ90684.1 hypothetical protein D5S19_02920 [Amycolatopsis panacis]